MTGRRSEQEDMTPPMARARPIGRFVSRNVVEVKRDLLSEAARAYAAGACILEDVEAAALELAKARTAPPRNSRRAR